MENVTLTADAFSAIKKGFAYVSAALIFIVLLVRWHFGAELGLPEFFRAAGVAIGVASCIFWMFYRWCWRVGPLPTWLGRPIVHGIWIGKLSSDYGRDIGSAPFEKHIVFVVRQTYLTLSIQSFTDRQVGESKVEALIQNKRTSSTRLAYVYELKNQYAGQSTLVNGAGDLNLISKASTALFLKGAYWTSSPTHGNLCLRRISDECEGIAEFSDAVRRWPLGPLWHAPAT